MFKRNLSSNKGGWMNSRAKTILETKKDNFKHVGEVKADETCGRMKMNVGMAPTCTSAFSIHVKDPE